ncbi:MAG: hypothetical protein CL927_20855 [Deltaproteobacteria bacterium]|nr:hypothetical protein [Deltaproteobacteria bacterium]
MATSRRSDEESLDIGGLRWRGRLLSSDRVHRLLTRLGASVQENPRLTRVLVADRRGAALRVLRWAHEAGVEVVALVQPEEDQELWQEAFDYTVPARRTGAGRWPDPRHVVSVLHDAGCDGVHPGWGEAARSPLLVEQLTFSGVAWAGPGREALGLAVDRGVSLIRAIEADIPVVPHSGPIADLHLARAWVNRVGFPVRIRPVDIEIGHPRPVLRTQGDFEDMMPKWLRIGPCVLERQVEQAREIEVPVAIDGSGHGVAIGDRDVTARAGRRHLVVEAPAPRLSDALRTDLAKKAVAFARALGWVGLATVRFLLAPDSRPYLLQLRPGLQPWHGATEAAFGVDLVDLQMRLATRDRARWTERDIVVQRAAIWTSIIAAGAGQVEAIAAGGGRVDPEVVVGEFVASGSLLAGMIAQAPSRQAAIVRLRSWMDEDPIRGVPVERADLDALVGSQRWWMSPLSREAVAEVLQAPSTTVDH